MDILQDNRKDFIIKVSENYFGKSVENSEKVYKNEIVDNFLNDRKVLLLCIDFTGSEILIEQKISPQKMKNALVFYKTSPSAVTGDNMNDLLRICSLQNPPLSSFYSILQNVYIPALFQNEQDAKDIKLRMLFENLQAGLKSAVVENGAKDTKSSLSDDNDKQDTISSTSAVSSSTIPIHIVSMRKKFIQGVLSLKDECDYWDYIVHSKQGQDKSQAKRVLQILSPLDTKVFQANKLINLEDLLEDAYNALDDVWKLDDCIFPQDRMDNLFDIIGNTVCQIIQENLKNKNVWKESFHEINELLLTCIEICNKWTDTCDQLTKIIWPNYSIHKWTGDPHCPNYIKHFSNRLKQIIEVRNVHQNICQILSKKEQDELNVSEVFSIFSDINPIQYNPYTDHMWKSALIFFDENLKPLEEHVGNKIKNKLSSSNGHVFQLLECFIRYQNLIQRNEIRNMIKSERQKLLILLQDYINEITSSDLFSNDAFSKKFPVEYIDLPELVLKIMWIKETIKKVKDMETVGQNVLHDLANYTKLKESMLSFIKELQANDSNAFNEWSSQTRKAIENANLSLRTEDPVVHFEQGKLMKVNYNPKLVKLIKEVHQLQLLGYKIPSKITEVADKAKLFMQRAKALEQVANFHNTIGDRMIPSQRPMMLSSAMDLSKLVKSENSVTWSDSSAVDQYISRLQTVVERLATENNELYFYHTQITQKVSSLADTDLLQDKYKWRDTLREIRNTIAEVNRKYSNTKTWLIHWDHQIYKVLQYRYQVGLLNLNQHLPEIKIELVYRQQRLQFNPPLEEIKKKYYSQLKRFITLPLTFQGVSEASSSIFPVMVSRNADQFQQVYANAENLFEKLLALQDEWIDRVALGAIDLESTSRDYITNADEWDMNFRTSKAWGQEIAKIVNCEHRVECFTVTTAPVRSEIELHNNRYWDVLSITLYSSIMMDVNAIEEFISDSKKKLDYQPQSLEEIGDASEAYRQIVEKSKLMLDMMEEMDKKNKVLSSWTKERVSQVATAKQAWNNFHTVLDNQQFHMNRQVETIKSKLINEADNLASELEKFVIRWKRVRPKETDLIDGNNELIENNLQVLKEKREEWNKLYENISKIRRDYEKFGIQVPDFSECTEFEKELKETEDIWGLYEQFTQGISELSAEEWLVFRGKSVNKFESFLLQWEEKLNNTTMTPLTARLVSDLQNHKNFISQIKYLRGEAFSDKHWSELCTLLNIPSKSIDQLTFGDFLKAQDSVISNLDAIQELNNRAASEIVIRQALAELDVWEVESKFCFMSHIDSKGSDINLIKDYKNILSKIGDNQCLLQSMAGSANYEQFRDHTSLWETKLIDLDYYLRNLNEVQRKWLYLEPIFKSETMKIEKARFERIDKDFRYIMNLVNTGDQRVISLCRIPNLRYTLDTLIQQLNICQKSLNEYLEEKRLKFPRFYFLSDDDLLEILGQANKPEVVQSHLKKLFAGINSVVFDKNNIIAVKSLEGETVSLNNPVTISLDVENWLSGLSVEMRETLKKSLIKCIKGADPLVYPSQILCLAESISFTLRCEEAIKQRKLKVLLKSLEDQLGAYTRLDLEMENNKETSVLELKLKALIFDTIYHISVVNDLINDGVDEVDEWGWQKRIRFYLKDGNISIKMVDAEFQYSFEYQGNAPKLVHTPLTDRCYLTLTQAMSMGLGGNPYGPAGTGKTESVKALGRLFGRQVLVFNCDEGLDIQSLTRILIGLVKCGAWGCFDEFNRLEEATLSAVSTHLHIIQEALRSNQRNIVLMNRQIELNPDTGIFVTMNPVGRGYGGRQKLPDNLKQLFRPIAMSQPDNLLIAEVILFSEGFKKAKLIARKLVQIFDIAKKVLSQQKHYDWGLRALKTVIGGCKTALKANKASTDIDEFALVVQAVRLNTLSKITFADAQQFDMLLKDTFQGVQFHTMDDQDIIGALDESFKDLKLQHNPRQVRKCLELYEQLEQRMGVVIVGPSGSGKSTISKLLKHALVKLGRTINQYTVNPKAMPRTQLLGQIDVDTRQWIDGILSTVAQRVYVEPLDIQSWILFDGDIDPEWIESLNSVLDDNRLLTLPSGWRIQFESNVHFLFETHSLQHASPATVSRMGIILMSEQDLDVKYLVESWLQKQSPEQTYELSPLIEKYFYKSLEWINTKGEKIANMSTVSLVRSCLSLMTGVTSKSQFCVSLMHGLGSVLAISSKEAFFKQILEWTEEFIPDQSKILFSYFNSTRNCIDCYSSDNTIEISGIVKTAQFKSCSDTLKTWMTKGNSFILVGPQGSGKSVLLDYCVQEIRGIEIVTICCSPQITPGHVLQKLTQVCMFVNSNHGLVFRPKTSERLVLHLKDLNLVQMDKWDSNILVSFLQQVLTYQGFYDPSHMEWVNMEQINFVCSLLSCDNLNPRFINSNNLISIWPPDQADLQTICLSYLRPLNVTEKLTSVMSLVIIGIYIKAKDHFSNESHSHYKFNLRDICNWCVALRRYNTTNNQEVVQALLYEGFRLFQDRLVNDQDKSQFYGIVRNVVDMELGQLSAIDEVDKLVYLCDDAGSTNPVGGTLRPYAIDDWLLLLQKQVSQLENEGEAIDKKILLPELGKMVVYFERVLTAPGGCLFLPGPSGYGRKTAVRIISKRQSARLFTLKMSTSYGINNFKNDLKSMLQAAGLDDQVIYFVFEDYHIISPVILDFINSLLASGEVPGLYQAEEFETLCSSLKDVSTQHDFQGSPSQFFVERVRRNLHVILITDFTHEEFFNRWESNPVLLRRCQTIWLSDWSTETKLSVVDTLSKGYDKDSESLTLNDAVRNSFIEIHENAKKFMNITPRHFTLLVKSFFHIKIAREESISENERKLKAGLSKLVEAKTIVAQLKQDAASQESKLAEKQSKANAALELITKTMQNASLQKSEMEVLKENMEKENDALTIRKKEIDVELAEVEPVLAEARSAVGNIKSESLSEIRSLRAPPDVIRDILEGVLRLMGIQDTSWNSMKTFLAKRGVKEDIRCFDARSIALENRLQVEELLGQREKSFEERTAKRASVAAAPLAAWVIANVKYSRILEKIKPLELEQIKLQNKLKESGDQILLLSSGLDDVEQTVSKLKEQLNTNTKEAAEIEVHLSKVQGTIAAAEGLVVKLDEEYSRWSEQVVDLSSNLNSLSNDCLLSSALIVYLSNSSEDIRKSTLSEWQKMLNAEKFELETFLSTEQEQLRWFSDGLPSDYISIQNAVIISQLSKMDISTCLRPLLIDPSNIALKWLQNNLNKNKTVELIPQHSQRLYTSLELAIRFGKSLIIHDVTSVDPILVPILRGNYTFQGTRKLIAVGEKLVDYNSDFQLYLICRDSKPNIPSFIKTLLTCINFEITYSGLSQQLLRCALSVEKPELEDKRAELLRKEEQLKSKLFVLQDNILVELANAQGNVLDNKELLATLNESKKSSSEIKQSLLESQRIQVELTDECEVYRPVAESAATLYFCTIPLQSINNFYQISIDTFIQIYKKIFSPVQEQIDFDIERKTRKLIQLVYQYISRFLFKEDLLTFALHLVRNMHPQCFKENEWELFSREILPNVKSDSAEVLNSIPSWANKEQAYDIYLLKQTLPKLYAQLDTKNVKVWDRFLNNNSHDALDLPLSPFQMVLVTQAFKPGFLHSALSYFAQRMLGLQRLSSSATRLDQVLPETNSKEPILLFVSSGADPSEEIRSLAKRIVGSNFYEIALGRGETESAIKLLLEAAENGHWLMMKNLHLMTSWLPVLEKELKSMSKVRDSFRLWLTTEPHPNLPSAWIQMCLKITYETPQGIKHNVERTYSALTNQPFVSMEHARSMFVLAWFHAIIQERRTFIPQGWCKFYEFNDSDLFTALKVINDRFKVDHRNSVKWEFIHGLCEQAIYGGRIDNNQDLLVLKSYLRSYFNSDVINSGRKLVAPDMYIPNSSNIRDFTVMIQKLSEVDSPELFSLPWNVDLSWQKNRSTDVINWLKVLKYQNILNKTNMEEWKSKISPILHLWKQLNQEAGILKMKTTQDEPSQEPIRAFIINEFNFATQLVSYIHKTLVDVNKAVRSSVTPNETTIALITTIVNQKTPDDWLSFWEGSKNVIPYLKNVMSRASFIMKIYKTKENAENLMTKSINLANFFNPQAFLNVFKQFSSRLSKEPLDSLKLECSWKNYIGDSKVTLTVEGLLIEGAHFKESSLTENSPNSPMLSSVPAFKIAWTSNDASENYHEGSLQIPVYHNSQRESIVMFIKVDIPSDEYDKWIQTNVAIYLQE